MVSEGEKKRVIHEVLNADITVEDWFEYIRETITDEYIKGVLSVELRTIGENWCPEEEDYRQEILHVLVNM